MEDQRTHEPVRATIARLPCLVAGSVSSAQVDTAVVFVHGFKGDPEKTWRHFMRETNGHASWLGRDLYFFGYPSTTEAIRVTANKVLEALLALLPVPTVLQDAGFERTEPYQRVVLVGHSQGGVVLRSMVLRALEFPASVAHDPGLELVRDADLRLFAPALGGARPAGLVGALLHAGLGRIAGVMLGLSRSYAELQPESTMLKALQSATEDRAQLDSEVRALFASIVWAEDDDIVTPVKYATDPYDHFEPLQTHKSVCKPTGSYSLPIEFLELTHDYVRA